MFNNTIWLVYEKKGGVIESGTLWLAVLRLTRTANLNVEPSANVVKL